MTTPSDLIEEVARAIMESNMRDTHLRLHKKGETWIFPADAWPKMMEENWNDAEVRGEALNSARAAASIIIEACAKVAEEQAALDRMSRGVDWCDQDEQARRWSAARRVLEGGKSDE